MKADEFLSEKAVVNGIPVAVTSYRVGKVWHCAVASADPGANIARADGTTRDEAVKAAMAKAEVRIKPR